MGGGTGLNATTKALSTGIIRVEIYTCGDFSSLARKKRVTKFNNDVVAGNKTGGRNQP
jgi:hypothetical protein